MGDDSTELLLNIEEALRAPEQEAREKPAALLVVGGPLNGMLFDLESQIVMVGRNAKNTIQLEFQDISRQHFKLRASAKTFILEDTGSTNGTYLNNSKINKPCPLKKGDIIKVGNIALKYLPAGDPERLTYDKLNRKANIDGLTGCYNKSYFNYAIELEVKKSKLLETPLSLVILDLDHFKAVNDNYGHDAGDSVLKDMAELVRKSGIREQDIFGRYGGEEFVILLPQTNLKQAYEIAERLRQLIGKYHFIYESRRIPVSASIGVADHHRGVINGMDLFRRADRAVYTAKKNGRNQVQLFKT